MFNLNEIINQAGSDEKSLMNSIQELNNNLAQIIAKSKQRHVELANEAELAKKRAQERERSSRSKSSSKDRDLEDNSSSDGAYRKSIDSKVVVNGDGNNYNSNYRYRKDYYGSSSYK